MGCLTVRSSSAAASPNGRLLLRPIPAYRSRGHAPSSLTRTTARSGTNSTYFLRRPVSQPEPSVQLLAIKRDLPVQVRLRDFRHFLLFIGIHSIDCCGRRWQKEGGVLS